jgi:hypothetical protein
MSSSFELDVDNRRRGMVAGHRGALDQLVAFVFQELVVLDSVVMLQWVILEHIAANLTCQLMPDGNGTSTEWTTTEATDVQCDLGCGWH